MLQTTKKEGNKTKIPQYEIVRVIGSGSFGKQCDSGYVFEGYDPVNKRKVALKRVEKVGNQLSREYEILMEIKECPYVVRILDFYYTRAADQKLIQNTIFEYVDSNLEDLIQENIRGGSTIPLAEIKGILCQLLLGLRFIHDRNISHRDLKPENVLYSADRALKICDFGSSKVIDEEGKNTPYIVSRYYRAPELIMCLTKYSTKIDIWGALIIKTLQSKVYKCYLFEFQIA